jgi:hypothetical protein
VSPKLRSWKRCQIDDEREGATEVQEHLGIGSQKLARLLLGEGNVEAVINSVADLQGDLDGTGQEKLMGMKSGKRCEQIRHECVYFCGCNSSLPLCSREGVSAFDGENIRSKEFVEPPCLLVTDTTGLV